MNFRINWREKSVRLVVLALAVGLMTLWYPNLSLPQEPSPAKAWSEAPSIHIQVEAKTWKTRGRLFWDVEGSLIKKLAATGFKIVRNEENPHQFLLKVFYREDRGEQYNINAYGTVIHAKFDLQPQVQGTPWEVTISESSSNAVSGTPPYIDVLDKFQTNPYYFFVEQILRGYLEEGLDPRGGLIYALQRAAIREQSGRGPSVSPGRDAGSHLHTSNSEREAYETRAIRRAIDDCVAASDRRMIPVLPHLLTHSDSYVKIRAIEAIGSFGVEKYRPHLRDLSNNDPDPQVRDTAKTIEQELGSFPHLTDDQGGKP